MESTSQKTFMPIRTFLNVAAVLFFILLVYPATSVASQYIVVRVIDGATIRILDNFTLATIRLVGSESDVNYGMKNGILGLENEGIFAVVEEWRL